MPKPEFFEPSGGTVDSVSRATFIIGAGAVSGGFLGYYGFGLAPSKDPGVNTANGVNDINRATSTSAPPAPCSFVGNPEIGWRCQ